MITDSSGGLRRFLLPLMTLFVYAFLYIPIAILIVFSFNDAVFPVHWNSFTLKWYKQLLHSPEIIQAWINSLIIAASSVSLSILMGLGLIYMSLFVPVRAVVRMSYLILVAPEIVLAVGLLSVLSYLSVPLGFGSLIVGHTLISLGFVIPILFDRFSELNPNIIEASLDLGATRWQTFRRILLPQMTPTIFAAALLVFTLSFDDFLISFFCTGGSVQTISLYIFAMIRSGVSPVLNALSTVIIVASSLLVFAFCLVRVKSRVF
ncbi:ABC transporter permease [bacterium]|jgi:spermidine/putrescine transport system permease protein|nr:ABC transporter permease [bacterium]MBT4577699.1 ABC transporter permease [bacterium]MBT5345524.1 ABC transporter permease [bacterium]MBT6131346.1 ABC transporter permease [bacterium]MBT6528833.1 ABC transporter permease [bacterium]